MANRCFAAVPQTFRLDEQTRPVPWALVPVHRDCRHYLRRTTAAGDALERCRVDAAEQLPFACPEFCLFFEARTISDAGWETGGGEGRSG